MASDARFRARQPAAAGAAIVVAIVLLSSIARLGAAKTDIVVDFDKTFAFAAVRTWMWHPDGPGVVKMAVSQMDDPKKVAARVDPIIIPTIEREMTSRGFARAADHADLYVHYYVLATVTQSAQYQGQFVPAVPEWGLPPFSPVTTALRIYPTGTLIIDVTSTASKAVVWRGAAEREIQFERPDDQRRKVLENAIHDLLKKLPARK